MGAFTLRMTLTFCRIYDLQVKSCRLLCYSAVVVDENTPTSQSHSWFNGLEFPYCPNNMALLTVKVNNMNRRSVDCFFLVMAQTHILLYITVITENELMLSSQVFIFHDLLEFQSFGILVLL